MTHFQIVCEDNKMIRKEKRFIGRNTLTFISQTFSSPLLFSSQCIWSVSRERSSNYVENTCLCRVTGFIPISMLVRSDMLQYNILLDRSPTDLTRIHQIITMTFTMKVLTERFLRNQVLKFPKLSNDFKRRLASGPNERWTSENISPKIKPKCNEIMRFQSHMPCPFR